MQQLAEGIKIEIALLQQHEPGLNPFERGMFEGRTVSTSNTQPVSQDGFAYLMLFAMDNRPPALLRTAERGDISALGKRTGRILSALLGSIAGLALIGLAVYRGIFHENIGKRSAGKRGPLSSSL